ncbi:MAG: NAD(P)-dependent oxidoreductase [Solirubrobacteraceae bacterium]
MNAKVLVTGAAGYIGAVLCEHLLDAGYDVTGVDNLTFGEPALFHLCANPHFDFVFGDIRDEALMRPLVAKADVIIALAAVVGAPACARDPETTRAVNLEAMRSLNRWRSPQQLLIYPNTNSGYGTKSGDSFCTEDTPLEPVSLYGQTKVEAELELLQTDNVITLRLATVFGTSARMRLDLLVNHFVHAAVTDGYIVIFEKDFRRNFIHIRDVADAYLHCIDNADAMVGRAYNAGLDTANISKEQLALKIKEHVPSFYLHFSEFGTDPDKRNYVVSNERLREAGFEAQRSLDDGIVELLKAYRLLGRGRFANV